MLPILPLYTSNSGGSPRGNVQQKPARGAAEATCVGARERNKQLIDDLEERLAVMVKRVSKDQQEYSRNYARSQSEVLKQRDEERKRLLSRPRTDLQQLCADLPGYLRDARSTFQFGHREFAAIYRK